MNVRQFFFGLLTATVVMTPFATLKPASATEHFNNQLIAQALSPGKKTVRRNSTGSAPQLTPRTISKDNLNHRAKATVNNVAKTHKKDQKPSIKLEASQFCNSLSREYSINIGSAMFQDLRYAQRIPLCIRYFHAPTNLFNSGLN